MDKECRGTRYALLFALMRKLLPDDLDDDAIYQLIGKARPKLAVNSDVLQACDLDSVVVPRDKKEFQVQREEEIKEHSKKKDEVLEFSTWKEVHRKARKAQQKDRTKGAEGGTGQQSKADGKGKAAGGKSTGGRGRRGKSKSKNEEADVEPEIAKSYWKAPERGMTWSEGDRGSIQIKPNWARVALPVVRSVEGVAENPHSEGVPFP